MRQIPGPIGVKIERTRDAARGLTCGGRLDDVHLIEQCCRQCGEVGLLRVDLIRRNEYFTVQHGADLRQAAHVHRRSDARVAVDLHAGDALKRVRDGHVGQLTDALRRDAVLDTRCQALHFDRANLRLAYAGNGDLLQLVRLRGRRSARRSRTWLSWRRARGSSVRPVAQGPAPLRSPPGHWSVLMPWRMSPRRRATPWIWQWTGGACDIGLSRPFPLDCFFPEQLKCASLIPYP